jgi:hypothetical protein
VCWWQQYKNDEFVFKKYKHVYYIRKEHAPRIKRMAIERGFEKGFANIKGIYPGFPLIMVLHVDII